MRYAFTKTVVTSDAIAGKDSEGKPILANRRFDAGAEVSASELATGCLEACIKNGTLIPVPEPEAKQETKKDEETASEGEATPESEEAPKKKGWRK